MTGIRGITEHLRRRLKSLVNEQTGKESAKRAPRMIYALIARRIFLLLRKKVPTTRRLSHGLSNSEPSGGEKTHDCKRTKSGPKRLLAGSAATAFATKKRSNAFVKEAADICFDLRRRGAGIKNETEQAARIISRSIVTLRTDMKHGVHGGHLAAKLPAVRSLKLIGSGQPHRS